MTYADNYNIRTTSVKFNDVADALDGLITRNYAGITSGTSSVYTASPTPAWDAYTTAGLVVIIPHVANAGACTLNVSGLGAKDLKIANTALAAGVLQPNAPTILAYTGVYFEVLLQNISIPPGTIYTYAGTSTPTGYLICDGVAYNTYTYRTLHAAISNTYGGTAYNPGVTDQPAAVTTFNLPDLRRRVPIGKGASDTLGGNDGVAYASRSATQSHSVPAHYHGIGAGAGLTAAGQTHTGNSSTTSIGSTSSGHGHGHSLTATYGGGHGHTYTINYNSNTTNTDNASQTRLKGTDSAGTARSNTTAIVFDTSGDHSHSVGGTVGGSDGTHSHTGVTINLDHTHSSSSVTGTIGLVTGGVSGNAAMTSGDGQYVYINYIIKT